MSSMNLQIIVEAVTILGLLVTHLKMSSMAISPMPISLNAPSPSIVEPRPAVVVQRLSLSGASPSVSGSATQQTYSHMANKSRMNERQILSKNHKGIEEMWLEVLERIQVTGLREFLYKEGKLISVSFGAAPTVQLMFSSQMTKSTAEKFTGHILQAFESVLGTSVTIEIRCESTRDAGSAVQLPLTLPATDDSSSHIRELSGVGVGVARAHPRREIIEEAASPAEHKNDAHQVDAHATSYRSVEGSSIGQASASQRNPIVKSHLDCRKLREQGQSKSIVKSKLTLLESIKSNPSEAVPLENSNPKTKSIAEVSLMWEMSLFKISKIVLGISQRIHPTAIRTEQRAKQLEQGLAKKRRTRVGKKTDAEAWPKRRRMRGEQGRRCAEAVAAARVASEHGLILVDTKYEFGKAEDGSIMLIDEVHTPDSSRYWIANSYLERFQNGLEPENVDKVLPEAPEDLVCELSWRYIFLYETITKSKFEVLSSEEPIHERISRNVASALASLK
ncbi:hypothetical protein HN873_064807 [Arachis hypogaea]